MDALIWMTGYAGSEVEFREFDSGMAYASFRLGCTPRVRRSGEWGDGETTWIAVTCSRGLAQNVQVSIAKGDPVVVAGRLRTQRWADKDGVEHERLTLAAEVVGHDLSRGTSRFTKVTRVTKQAADPEEIGELVVSVEEQAEADPDDEGASAA